MHNIGQVYCAKVKQLTDRLKDPEARLIAIEAIQDLIEHIWVARTNADFDVDLHGRLSTFMELVDTNNWTTAAVSNHSKCPEKTKPPLRAVYVGCGSLQPS